MPEETNNTTVSEEVTGAVCAVPAETQVSSEVADITPLKEEEVVHAEQA